jgi:hypothetical protein
VKYRQLTTSGFMQVGMGLASHLLDGFTMRMQSTGMCRGLNIVALLWLVKTYWRHANM